MFCDFLLSPTAANVLVVIATSGVVAILEYHGLKNKISVTGTIKAGMPDFTPPKFAINKGNITMSSTELLTVSWFVYMCVCMCVCVCISDQGVTNARYPLKLRGVSAFRRS